MKLLDLNNDDVLHILSFLDNTNVLAMSETCTLLQDFCRRTASLWRSFTVNKGQEKNGGVENITLTEEEKRILEISDDRIRNMHISVDFSRLENFFNIDRLVLESMNVLNIAVKKSNLQEFCFEAFDICVVESPSKIYSFTSRTLQNPKLSEAIIRVIENSLTSNTSSSARLRTLSLSTNNWRETSLPYKCALLNVLRSSTFCERLESFTLDRFLLPMNDLYCDFDFWEDNDQYKIMCAYGEVIGKFTNLHTLEINSLYLTDSLLDALSQPGRVRLQRMTLCVGRFHDRDITSWPRLLQSSPSLKVTVHAGDSVYRSERFLRALPPCVPIVSLKFCCSLYVSLENMFDMFPQYAQTLERVVFKYSSVYMHESLLLEMITPCPCLHTFYFNGQISCNAILEMASFRRNWLKLGVSEEDIVFPEDWNDIRTKNVERLCVEVSKKLGREWKPDSEEIFHDMFSYIRSINIEDNAMEDFLRY